jgi:hypothetical protein
MVTHYLELHLGATESRNSVCGSLLLNNERYSLNLCY